MRSSPPTLCWLCLALLPLHVRSAVIEVTACGVVSEPTYWFSDATGSPMATLTGSSSAVTSSVDLATGSGNSVNDLAARLAAAEATVAETASSTRVDNLTARLAAAEATIATLGGAMRPLLEIVHGLGQHSQLVLHVSGTLLDPASTENVCDGYYVPRASFRPEGNSYANGAARPYEQESASYTKAPVRLITQAGGGDRCRIIYYGRNNGWGWYLDFWHDGGGDAWGDAWDAGRCHWNACNQNGYVERGHSTPACLTTQSPVAITQ
jgi:hypothetical protein